MIIRFLTIMAIAAFDYIFCVLMHGPLLTTIAILVTIFGVMLTFDI